MSTAEPVYHIVAESADVPENEGRPFTVDGRRIAVVRHGGTLYAIDDTCTHADASLALGPVGNGCIACPWHYAEFELATGKALSGPATGCVQTHLVRESSGKIEVAVQDEEPGAEE